MLQNRDFLYEILGNIFLYLFLFFGTMLRAIILGNKYHNLVGRNQNEGFNEKQEHL